MMIPGEIITLGMRQEIQDFIDYLQNEREASENTRLSYGRDLLKMAEFLEPQGITEPQKVTKAVLNAYLLSLEKQGKAATTISRVLASVKAFFHYEMGIGRIRRDPSESIHAPKIEKKIPTILTVNEVSSLLSEASGESCKEIRDRAMLELLYATGIRVSELIGLKMSDINMAVGFITCRDGHKERMVPFGRVAKEAVARYLEFSRDKMLKGRDSQWLFTNCSGGSMSRQGFWKIIKFYGKRAGIEADITPHSLRHSFAAHLLSNGADVKAVQTMMGHSDLSTTQMYMAYAGNQGVREVYQEAHPRK